MDKEIRDKITVVGWKFGKDTVTVKYENNGCLYTLATAKEPRSALLEAASEIAVETRRVMGFRFGASFSALAINAGSGETKTTATVILDAETALGESAELKCPKISRAKKLDLSLVGEQTFPGMEAEAFIPERYADHETLNLTIDGFLTEAERFVRDCGKKERGLFDDEARAEASGRKATGE
jgi:hypothetical protein